jgi:hypothetical protein
MIMDSIERAVLAYDINSYICIDEFGSSSKDSDFVREIEEALIEPSTPESLLMEKEHGWAEDWFFNELSEEAKQVLLFIDDCPDVMKSVVGVGKGKNLVSIKKLGRYLREHWEERKVVKKVLQEIAEYAVNLESY